MRAAFTAGISNMLECSDDSGSNPAVGSYGLIETNYTMRPGELTEKN